MKEFVDRRIAYPGTIVAEEGAQVFRVLLVKSGTLEVTSSEYPGEVITMGEGSLIGDTDFALGRVDTVFRSTAKVLETAELISIPVDHFIREYEKASPLMKVWMKSILARSRKVFGQMHHDREKMIQHMDALVRHYEKDTDPSDQK